LRKLHAFFAPGFEGYNYYTEYLQLFNNEFHSHKDDQGIFPNSIKIPVFLELSL